MLCKIFSHTNILYIFLIGTLILPCSKLFPQSGWVPLNSGTTVNLFDVHCVTNNIVYSVGYSGSLPFPDGNVIKTTNSGINWISQYNNGVAANTALVSLFFVDENTGWLVGYENAIYKTTNGGNNYFPQTFPGVWHETLFENSLTGWIVGEWGLDGIAIKTTNGGNSWVIKTTYPLKHFTGIDFINENTGFISVRNGIILKTTNSGNNWVEFNQGTNLSFYSITFPSSTTGFVAGLQQSVYKTTNSGTNWFAVAENLGHYVNSLEMINNQFGFLAGGFEFNSGVIRATNDGGINWYQQYSSNLELKSVSFVNSSIGFCVGMNGQIVRTTNGGGSLNVNQISTEIPLLSSLMQNYPNPFNPITKIRFNLSKSSKIKLIVYDNLGNEIETIANLSLMHGLYETDFNASNLSSGIYFYKIITEDYSETKKMILIK